MSIDLSFLSSYYAARMPARTIASAGETALSPLRKPLPAGTTPPWDRPEAKGTDANSAKLRRALEVKDFVDMDDPAVNRAGLSKDQKKLFALYKGLQTLQALAERAGDEKTLSGERSGLARRFAAGFEDVRSTIAKGGFDDLTLLLGDKSSDVTSDLAIPRTRSEYRGNIVSTGGSDQPLANIAGTEAITVTVTRSSGTVPVTLNLSEITGGITIDSIIAALNQKMSDAGVATRFRRFEEPGANDKAPKRYGITVAGIASERVSFSASNASPSLTLVGVTGKGDTQRGQITKLMDLNAAAPVNAGSEKVELTDGVSDAKAVAKDADGNVFVVGAVTGDLGTGIVQGAQDVYLRKYDSANNLVWSRLLGSADTADGFALAVDGSGNAIVAGKVRDRLTATATGSRGDSFVTKFSGEGVEVFTRQAGSVLEDQANALTVDASGDIYVGGSTRGQLVSGQTAVTGSDAYIQKLSSTGALLFTRTFGSGSDERVAGLAIADDGQLVAASVENGVGVVRKFSSSNATSAATWDMSLGALQSGSIGGLAARGGAVYVSGTTQNANLTGGGAASVTTAHSGGGDAFVFKLTDAGATASADFVAYAGSSGADAGAGLTVTNDAIYLSGSTRGGLPGQNTVTNGATQGFVQKLSLTGVAAWTHQFSGANNNATAAGVVVDDSGASVLDALGLPRGPVAMGGSRLVTAQSSVRAGDFFTIQVNDGPARKIFVQAGDTMRALAQRVDLALGLKGGAEVSRGGGGDKLKIEVNNDSTVTLKAGTAGLDALAGLGLQPGVLYGKDAKDRATRTDDLKSINSFALKLGRNLDLTTDRQARMAAASLNGAMEAIKQASRRLVDGPPPPEPKARREEGPAPAFLQNQLASYQTALMAFGGGGGSGGGQF
jgi:hypothetical protein